MNTLRILCVACVLFVLAAPNLRAETPAELKSGDVIVKVADKVVANSFDFERALWNVGTGPKAQNVQATVLRDGQLQKVSLTPAQAVRPVSAGR